MNDLDPLLDAAARAAVAAGALLRARPTRVDHKGAIDLVTEVDLASEARIREILADTGLPVQGEEKGGVTTGTRWVVDPLDGTTNFVHNYGPWCVSIGLVDGDVPVGGVLFDPTRERLYRAGAGLGATCNGVKMSVSNVRKLEDALTVTGFPYARRDAAAEVLRYVERAVRHTQGLRLSGSAAMDLCAVGDATVELFWELGLSPWDTCAGAVVVREAGGVVTRLDGGAWTPDVPQVLATNGWLHEAAIELFVGLEPTWA